MEEVPLPRSRLKIFPVAVIILLLAAAAAGYYYFFHLNTPDKPLLSPLSSSLIKPKPLEKYSFDNLSQQQFSPSPIEIKELITSQTKFDSHLFSFTVEDKKVTGQANIPTRSVPESGFPVIIMLRGYVDKDIYETGVGTRRAAEVFAQNGFITLAPDFLGYGGSDPESEDVFQARFQKTTAALQLLASVNTLEQADPERIGLWGHSNGGQIALSVLTITGQPMPTTLWAPVSKPFPYSILYYTDELDDEGKYLRRHLAQFEADYDIDQYSLTNYLDRLSGPLQLHQGGADEDVPQKWSDQLAEKLEELDQDISYYTYPSADHNLQPNWNTVVSRDLAFFRRHL
jgi:dipeptidyl aminopeptidase/acylaminoacyl peptidase